MTSDNADEERNEEIAAYVHKFSREAFEIAKQFVEKGDSETLKRQATELRARLPEVVSRFHEADDAYKPDLNQTLSEARLDLDYVQGGGNRPSSLRLAGVIAEHEDA